ncbi:MAG: FtsX-like permease family protein, partial [Lachnospiraceae bacterium]|nr:FtsX-like permease family protein [Lachnospiraceae bacterium]
GFNERMEEQLGDGMNTAINILSVIEGSARVYVSLMRVIIVAILLLSAATIAFVLYLLVRTLLNSRKRDYGILKALGFTTGQLVLQTAASFLPAVILSTIAGIVVSSLVINPLTALFLSGIGIVKCTFTVPAGLIAVSGAGMVLLAFGLACLLALRIRKIVPVDLLAGE